MSSRISSANRSATGDDWRRPLTRSGILIRVLFVMIGLVTGGFAQEFLRRVVPGGAAKSVLTAGFIWASPPSYTVHLGLGSLTFGPFAIDVSAIGAVTCVSVIIALRRMFL